MAGLKFILVTLISVASFHQKFSLHIDQFKSRGIDIFQKKDALNFKVIT